VERQPATLDQERNTCRLTGSVELSEAAWVRRNRRALPRQGRERSSFRCGRRAWQAHRSGTSARAAADQLRQVSTPGSEDKREVVVARVVADEHHRTEGLGKSLEPFDWSQLVPGDRDQNGLFRPPGRSSHEVVPVAPGWGWLIRPARFCRNGLWRPDERTARRRTSSTAGSGESCRLSAKTRQRRTPAVRTSRERWGSAAAVALRL